MRQDHTQPPLWRVFVPLLPYAALLAALHVLLWPWGLAWLTWLIVAALVGGVLLYVWLCRQWDRE